jgi:glutamate synthase domain-containing protein 1
MQFVLHPMQLGSILFHHPMCGIVGLFLKNPALEPELGDYFSTMLECLSSRGPDSAGLAIYGDEVPPGWLKLTLQHPAIGYDWAALAAQLRQAFPCDLGLRIVSTHAVVTVQGEDTPLRKFLRQQAPEVRVMSSGLRMEMYKEVGSPCSVLERFEVRKMRGSHAIGHTRMATESAVTTAGSHPFSTGLDLCLVHNGSLSNHNRLRARLQRAGIEFESDNDSEVAAGFLTQELRAGQTLERALEKAIQELDGFYTFAIGTRDGFAVLRDPIACKPAVMAENDDFVAMASEYRSLADLPGIAHARLWEPEPATVYSWSRTGSINQPTKPCLIST